MLTDINYDIEQKDYELLLCKTNEEPITFITDYFDLKYKNSLKEINELTFSIPKTIQDFNGEIVENEIYSLLKGDMLILLNDEEFLIIDDVNEIKSSEGTYKDVVCFGREFELSYKYYRGFESDSIKLYEMSPAPVNPQFSGVLNYLEYLTSWRIDYYDMFFNSVYRGVSISENNIIEVLKEMQVKYGCMFVFDSLNKKINVYQPDNLIQDRGFYIDDEKYIESINKKINHNKIKTRLRVYGKDNTSIENYTITGKDYIENFDFYKDNGYMSEELVSALDQYESDLIPFENNFNLLLNSLSLKEQEIIEAETNETSGIQALQSDLVQAEDNLDLAIARSNDLVEEYSSFSSFPLEGEAGVTYIDESNGNAFLWDSSSKEYSEIENYLTVGEAYIEVSNAENALEVALDELYGTGGLYEELDEIIEDINLLRANLESIQISDPALLSELDSFTKEEIYRDNNYSSEMMGDLYDEAVLLLNQISQPAILIETNIIDFLKVLECQHDWNKLKVGDTVTVVSEELNIDFKFNILSYDHDDENGTLTLQLSNGYNYNDIYSYEEDYLGELSATTTAVDFSRYDWDKAKDNESLISQYINSELNTANQAIKTAEDQAPLIDHRGIWLRKITNDITDPKQIRMINNIIAITNDNWNTVSTAITGNGINAEVVRGKLGIFAKIDSHQVNIISSTDLDELVLEEGEQILTQFNGITMTSDEGIVITRADENVSVSLNASSGISIESYGEDVFQIDTSGNLLMTGELQAGSIISDSSITINRDDGLARILMDTVDGIKIQKFNGATWETKLKTNLSGDIELEGNITLTGGYINWDSVNQFDVPPGYSDSEAIAAIENTYIDGNGVWTPEVYAENINTTNAKINVAQIENLIVGDNVSMGPSATISWTQVTDKPSDPSLPAYIQSTYIDSAKIITPTLYGNDVKAQRFEIVPMTQNPSDPGDITFGATSGYMGEGFGSDGIEVTNGVMVAAGNVDPDLEDGSGNYFIVTDAGVRMQAGDYSLYCVDSDAAGGAQGVFWSDGVESYPIGTGGTVPSGGAEVFYQPEEPTEAEVGDLWIDSDDFSRYDIMNVSSNMSLVPGDPEMIFIDGGADITLFSAIGNGGCLLRFKNIGGSSSTINTLTGETFDGLGGITLAPNESINMISNGSNWYGLSAV